MNKVFKFFVFLLVILLFMLSSKRGWADDSPVLRELIEPNSIALDQRQIYIPEGTSIYIYDLRDFRLKKRIGQRGEGPQEFLLDVLRGAEELFIDVQTPVLLVNSLGKVSFFNKGDGSFIRELKSRTGAREFKPLGLGFAGQGMVAEEGIQYRSVNIYDSQLNKVKEVFKVKHHFQMGEGLRVLPAAMTFAAWGGKLFIAWEENFVIRVFDQEGNPLYTIQREYERLKVPEWFKEQIVAYFKTHKRYKRIFEMLDPKIIFPATFPAIADMKITDGKMYVTTYRIDEENADATQCFVFDVKGNFLKELTIPLRRGDGLLPYPYAISAGKLYQLVEEGEHWRLKITGL